MRAPPPEPMHIVMATFGFHWSPQEGRPQVNRQSPALAGDVALYCFHWFLQEGCPQVNRESDWPAIFPKQLEGILSAF